MKTLKKILMILSAIIGLLLIVALFVPRDYSVEREVTINKPRQEIFDYIRFLKNQDNYSKWNKMDPAMTKSYSGTDGTVGFVYSWKSQNDQVGVGEQEIKGITDGYRMDMEIRFKVPFESTAQAYMTTESVTDMQTLVKWGFKGHMPYPFNLMGLFMGAENMIGGDLQTGLNNLKMVMQQ